MSALRRDFLPPELRDELRRAGFDASIAVQARNTLAETDFLLALARNNPIIAAVVGWVDLHGDDLVPQLERWQDRPLLRGFRHTLQDEPDMAGYVNDHRFRHNLTLLQSRGYVYDVLVREPQLTSAVALCARHSTHWLVLDHLGKPDIRSGTHAEWARALQPLRHMPHVVCKLSGLVTEAGSAGGEFEDGALWPYLDTALAIFGPQRLMFGSDWPVCLLAASHQRVQRILREWSSHLSVQEQSSIWGGTAMQTYHLKQEHGVWI